MPSFSALLHRAGRAGPHAPRVLAVEAGHEHEPHAWTSVHVDRAEGDQLTRVGSGAEILVGLAVNLAGQAADAVGLVVAQDVLAHRPVPPVARRATCTTVSVKRVATAGRVEVVELVVLQALVSDAEAQGAGGERHGGAVAVQHEHRVRVDPRCHLRLHVTRVAATAVDVDLVAVGDAERRGAVGVDPEHLFGRDLVEDGVVEGLAVGERGRLREQQREPIAGGRRLGLVGRQAGQARLGQDGAVDLDLSRRGREAQLVARRQLGRVGERRDPGLRASRRR